MAVAEVEILCSVVIYGNKLSAGVVGVELLDLARAAALHLRHQQAAVVVERGRNAVHRFAAAHALLVIGVARRGAVAGKALDPLYLPLDCKSRGGAMAPLLCKFLFSVIVRLSASRTIPARVLYAKNDPFLPEPRLDLRLQISILRNTPPANGLHWLFRLHCLECI